MNRRHRLGGRRAIDAVRARRAVAGSGSLRVHVAPNDLAVARIAFAVPRSAGGAVVRNRIRRRLRALLRPALPELAGLDLVVGARTAAASQPSAVLAGDLLGSVRRARGRL